MKHGASTGLCATAAASQPRNIWSVRRAVCAALYLTLIVVGDGARGEAASGLVIDGSVTAQGRFFAAPGFSSNARWQQSAAADADVSWTATDGAFAFRAKPFVRVDDTDPHRSHADLRELYVSHVGAGYELHAGLRRVFWGVSEFLHLVDVINQVDLVEDIDEEDRLGQPMLQLVVPRGAVTLEAFLLPGFRERRFPGRRGRLRGPLPIDGHARYAASARRQHVDGAVRLSAAVGALDVGVAHFSGTSREPRLLLTLDRGGAPQLTPYYETIDQTSVDGQWLVGSWAFKAEALTRQGQGGRYRAAVVGFERTYVGAIRRADLGFVMEALWDDRGRHAPPGHFEHDLALGLRLTANDAADSTLLFGVVRDLSRDEHSLSLEASRRLGAGFKVGLEARTFGSHARGPALNALSDRDSKTALLDPDDYVQLEITAFF